MESGLSRGGNRTPSRAISSYAFVLERVRRMSTPTSEISPVRDTLRRVVVMGRLVGWAWSLAMIAATVKGHPDVNNGVALDAATLGSFWAALTLAAAWKDRFLSNPIFVVADGVVALLMAAAAWAAGAPDFISGGYPMSWLFVVAYATSLRWTMVAAFIVTLYVAVFHGVLNLGVMRTVGSIQFLVVGLIAGWAFDSLREREALRLEAETGLRLEQQAAARHEERASLAGRLHDSVLQTLHVIRMEADDPAQVRYLARRQERELRRTIDEFRSPHQQSFRAELLGVRDEIEDLCRVEVDTVIRDDAELTPPLVAAVAAAREAMINAAKHSGATQIHLYSEISDGIARLNVRDRGLGIADGLATINQRLSESLVGRVAAVSGAVVIESAPGHGTDVTITVPWP
jgi:signal transduction histidine kinase